MHDENKIRFCRMIYLAEQFDEILMQPITHRKIRFALLLQKDYI